MGQEVQLVKVRSPRADFKGSNHKRGWIPNHIDCDLDAARCQVAVYRFIESLGRLDVDWFV
jgi:hypothetical protein